MENLSTTGKQECTVVKDTLEANDSKNSFGFLPIRSTKRFLLSSASVCLSTDSNGFSPIPVYMDLYEVAAALNDIRDQLKFQVK